MRNLGSVAAVLVGMGTLSASALGAAFTNGNVIVTRISGSGGVASAAFLDEYTTTGALVQSIPLPTADAGGNQTCTMSVGANDGYLSFSTNNQYLTFACHDAVVGVNATTGTHARVVARVDMNGVVDTTTQITNQGSGWSPKSAVMNGNDIWMTGGANNKAIIYTTFGANTGTVITNTTNGARVTKIFDNQLYLSVDPNTGNPQGVFTVGSGLPTTTGQSASILAGSSVNADMDIWDFWFADPSTLYFSDVRATASGGGIQKWTFNGSTWSKQYTLASGLTNGVFGVYGVNEGGVNRLFGTTVDNKIVSVSDTGVASAFTTIATGNSGNIYRGILYTVPEPGSLALVALGAVALLRRRSR